jgi:hypothetical protein
MKEVSNTNLLVQKFSKHNLADHINFKDNTLKIISPQPPIGNWLYLGLLVFCPLLFSTWQVYQSGFGFLIENHFHLILPLGALILYFYLNNGNNNFLIDFNDNVILIQKTAPLARIIYRRPKVISFDQIENIKIEESAKHGNKNYGETLQYDFKVFLVRKGGIKKIVLIEFTEMETKVNKELATILANFLKLNIFHRLTGSNPK